MKIFLFYHKKIIYCDILEKVKYHNLCFNVVYVVAKFHWHCNICYKVIVKNNAKIVTSVTLLCENFPFSLFSNVNIVNNTSGYTVCIHYNLTVMICIKVRYTFAMHFASNIFSK